MPLWEGVSDISSLVEALELMSLLCLDLCAQAAAVSRMDGCSHVFFTMLKAQTWIRPSDAPWLTFCKQHVKEPALCSLKKLIILCYFIYWKGLCYLKFQKHCHFKKNYLYVAEPFLNLSELNSYTLASVTQASEGVFKLHCHYTATSMSNGGVLENISSSSGTASLFRSFTSIKTSCRM